MFESRQNHVNRVSCTRLTIAPPDSLLGTHIDSIHDAHHDASMRTTVTLEDDVVDRLKELAHRNKASFKETLNEVIRRGLTAPAAAPSPAPFEVEPYGGGFRPGIDPNRLNQLLDELDAEEFSRDSRARG